jgi:hypothetical protein
MNSDFLFTDEFLSTAKKTFDEILFESTIKESDFLWSIAYHTRQEQKLLIVVSKTPVDVIFPLIQNGKAKVILINPSCGLTGFANKWYWDIWDVSKAKEFSLDVVEPIYQEQIIDFFDNKTSSYIRINEHTPWKYQIPNIKKTINNCVSLQEYWYSWSHGTILCFWSLLIDVLYGAGFLQEEGHAMDVFVSDTPFFILSEQLKESIQRTEKLIIIVDQHLWSFYEFWIKWILYEIGLFNISTTFITPSYQNISSVAMEYMYEQAKIDWVSIKSRILK